MTLLVSKGRNYCFRYFIYYFLLFLFCASACNEKSKPDLIFAVIGDIHYKIPDFHSADYLVPSVSKEFDSMKLRPEFIIQTGDFFHGSNGTDIESEAVYAFKNFDENFDMPFFIAKGNHDAREYYEKNAFPLFSQELGSDVLKSYYSFDKANCHFIMLDCTDEKLTDQLSWLEKDLEVAKSNSGIEHVFVAGHYPLWIVARAGFTNMEYADLVSKLLAKYQIDAYFCGHTHNHTTTVKMIDGTPLTQIMGAAVVEDGRLSNLAPFLKHVRKVPENIYQPGLLALEETHKIFIDSSKLKYYWGNQEGSTSSYYVITVSGKTVQVDYHILGSGTVRSYKWDKPGELVDLTAPEVVKTTEVTEEDFSHIKNAWLYTAPWTSQDAVTAPIKINNVNAGELDMSYNAVAYSMFWNKIEYSLGQSTIDALKKKNIIQISNPEQWEFGLANIFILVQFEDGRFAKSTLSPHVLTSYEPKEETNYIPVPGLIHWVTKGDDLEKVELMFDKIYNTELNK